MMLDHITLTKETHERCQVSLTARIKPDGALVLEGHDRGPAVQDAWSRDDYEYWQTVPPGWRDTVLLRLLAERFTSASEAERFGSDSQFAAWLDRHGIPCDFDSWP